MALVGASLLVSHIVRRERARADYDVAPARLVVSAAQLALGLLFMIVSGLGGPDAMGLIGLGFVIVGGGAIVSEVRRARWKEGWRGPVVLSAALVVVAGSLIVLPADDVLRPAGLGVVLAMFGAEIYSEDYLRTIHTWGRWTVAGAGNALMLIALGLLIGGGTGGLPALVLVLSILAVVWMIASDSDSLLLVVVVAAALLWAGAPRPAGRSVDAQPVPDQPFFLVLGDSYISGEGASVFYDGTNSTVRNADFTNECRRAPTAWPNRLARMGLPNVPSHVLFLACSGAETRHLRATPPEDGHGHQNGPAELVEYQQRRAELGLQQKPAFVVVSLGGNDAGFGAIGRTCVGPGDCAEIGYKFLDGLQSVEAKLDQAYADIKSVVATTCRWW